MAPILIVIVGKVHIFFYARDEGNDTMQLSQELLAELLEFQPYIERKKFSDYFSAKQVHLLNDEALYTYIPLPLPKGTLCYRWVGVSLPTTLLSNQGRA